MFYYDKETMHRRFAFHAFEHTRFRAALCMLTWPIVVRRSHLFGRYGTPDDFPDITFIWPGGKMLPNILASSVPLAPDGETPLLSTDPGLAAKVAKPLPKFRTLFKPRDQT